MLTELIVLLPLTWLCWNIIIPVVWIVVNYTYGAKNQSARRWLVLSGEWAVVTGACGPIGRAYACELAKEKLNVMLIDEDSAKLQELASDIDQKYGVQTQCATANFSTTNDYDTLSKSIDALPSIGCLVNAADLRYSRSDRSATSDGALTSIESIERMILCNIQSTASFTRMCLRKMILHQPYKAAVINVSSALANIPCPAYPVYAASKTFVCAFSRGLREELRLPSVIIQAVCPGPLTFTPALGSRQSGDFIAPSPTVFVQSALGMLGVEDETSGYWAHAMMALFMSHIPHPFIKIVLSKFSKLVACKPSTS